jgi:demethylmenaquinone methyltransferase / 2-methoxy-6-polyprenyl-1,4-benzoquinol methylase
VTRRRAEPSRASPSAAPHPVLAQYYARDADRQGFVTSLFDGAAAHYDWICRVMSLGSGQAYRRLALKRAGLAPGMRLLDVATGTGLVAGAALNILREPGAVIGLDPSRGMLREARKRTPVHLVQGRAEDLPFASDHFDVLSVGYALRHVADLRVAFDECLRVLKPGGRLVILEISRPSSAVGWWLLRVYLRRVLPLFARMRTRSPHVALLTRYYWDTIAECVSPQTILDVLRGTGFVDVERCVTGGLLSDYTGTKAASPGRSRVTARG